MITSRVLIHRHYARRKALAYQSTKEAARGTWFKIFILAGMADDGHGLRDNSNCISDELIYRMLQKRLAGRARHVSSNDWTINEPLIIDVLMDELRAMYEFLRMVKPRLFETAFVSSSSRRGESGRAGAKDKNMGMEIYLVQAVTRLAPRSRRKRNVARFAKYVRKHSLCDSSALHGPVATVVRLRRDTSSTNVQSAKEDTNISS